MWVVFGTKNLCCNGVKFSKEFEFQFFTSHFVLNSIHVCYFVLNFIHVRYFVLNFVHVGFVLEG